MKKRMLFPVILFSLTLATGALAAEESASQSSENQQQGQTAAMEQSEDQIKPGKFKDALSFIGKSVQDSGGEKIGKVAGLLLDPDTGQVRYLTVSAEEVSDLAGGKYAVPWKAVHMTQGGEAIAVNLPVDKFKAAPKTVDLGNRQQEKELSEFYGVAPYWEQEGLKEPGVEQGLEGEPTESGTER